MARELEALELSLGRAAKAAAAAARLAATAGEGSGAAEAAQQAAQQHMELAKVGGCSAEAELLELAGCCRQLPGLQLCTTADQWQQ